MNAIQTASERTIRLQPDVDIFETTDAIHVQLDMPGLTHDAIDVAAENGVLTVRATRSGADDGSGHLRREVEVGDYFRQFRVGNEVDSSATVASYRDGVLELRLPKRDPQRRIQVREGR